MNVSHRTKIFIQAEYQRWQKSLEKIMGDGKMEATYAINLKVTKPEYLILSQRAAELQLQIGHYCARVLRASLEPEEESEKIAELEADIKDLMKIITELETQLQPTETKGVVEPE